MSRYLSPEWLERELKKRPSGHAEPTDQDIYWDSGPLSDVEDLPWLDQQDDHEAEL